jgi:hypothetical protein
MERTPEIRGVAEPQRKSDILVRQIRAAKVFQRKLSPQFIAQPRKEMPCCRSWRRNDLALTSRSLAVAPSRRPAT